MEEINQLLIQEVRRALMAEGVVRIKQCLSELTPKEVWLRPNANSNSVGNLVSTFAEMCGNGLSADSEACQTPAKGLLNSTKLAHSPSAELLSRLDAVREVDDVLNRLKPEDLTKPIVVQGFEETGLSIIGPRCGAFLLPRWAV
ncbi:MAG: hypothetical protein R2788_09555 [Saprospiraceae bacterium]